MTLMGEQIRLARLRRNRSIAQVAERTTCFPLTINRIEKVIRPVLSVSMPVFSTPCNWIDLLLIAKEDTLGHTLQDLNLKHRQRASKKNN